jgi:hypothetical protein
VTAGLRRPGDPSPLPWLAIASCVLAIVGATVFIAGSTYRLEGSYAEEAGTENVGVNFSFANNLGTGGTAAVVAGFVAGAVLAVVALVRQEPRRPVAFAGLALNAVLGLLVAAVEVFGYLQGAG